MKKLELTCIGCPKGCDIDINYEDGKIISIEGFTCPKGETYAKNEFEHPMRMLAGSMFVKGSNAQTVSCRTEKEIPKEKVLEAARALKTKAVNAPIKIGDILIKNIANTGVNIIATKDIN